MSQQLVLRDCLGLLELLYYDRFDSGMLSLAANTASVAYRIAKMIGDGNLMNEWSTRKQAVRLNVAVKRTPQNIPVDAEEGVSGRMLSVEELITELDAEWEAEEPIPDPFAVEEETDEDAILDPFGENADVLAPFDVIEDAESSFGIPSTGY